MTYYCVNYTKWIGSNTRRWFKGATPWMKSREAAEKVADSMRLSNNYKKVVVREDHVKTEAAAA